MSGALYYPSWTLRDPISFAEFLMNWDRLTFMTPEDNWDFNVYHEDDETEKVLREAHDRYAISHMPTDEEKDKCHRLLTKLMESDRFVLEKYVKVSAEKSYEIHANKLDQRTLRMLEHQSVMEKYFGERYKVSQASGKMVMAVLAHCCSSNGLPAVTRNDNQYKLHMLSLSDLIGVSGSEGEKSSVSKFDAFTILVNKIEMPGLNTDDPRSLSKVLIARKKDDVNGYRIAYQKKMDAYCERLQNSASPAETKDIICDFDQELSGARRKLIKELKGAGVDAIISKEGAIAFVAGCVLSLASLGLGAIFASAIELRTYQKARREVLGNNWTSWLYNVQHPRFSVW